MKTEKLFNSAEFNFIKEGSVTVFLPGKSLQTMNEQRQESTQMSSGLTSSHTF